MSKLKMRRALLIPASLLFAACNGQEGDQQGMAWWLWLLLLVILAIVVVLWWRGRQKGASGTPAPTPKTQPAPPATPVVSAPPAKPVAVPEPMPVAAVETVVAETADDENTEVAVGEAEAEADTSGWSDDTPEIVEVGATRTATADVVEMPIAEPDDLRKIEGIGPKISQTLNDAGITSFAALAASDSETLRQILDDAGISRISDPATWPAQARFAAAGDWDGLGTLQDSLKGGRKID